MVPVDQVDSRYGTTRQRAVEGELRVIPTLLETAYNIRNFQGRIPAKKNVVLAEDNLKDFGEMNRFSFLSLRTIRISFIYLNKANMYCPLSRKVASFRIFFFI